MVKALSEKNITEIKLKIQSILIHALLCEVLYRAHSRILIHMLHAVCAKFSFYTPGDEELGGGCEDLMAVAQEEEPTLAPYPDHLPKLLMLLLGQMLSIYYLSWALKSIEDISSI